MAAAREFLMGLDAGSSAGRCVLVDAERGDVTIASQPWQHPRAPGTSGLGMDLDLDLVWAKLARAARGVLDRAGARPDQVRAIAATSTGSSLVVLDGSRRPLLALPSRDARACAEALEILARFGDPIRTRMGRWPTPAATLPRLLWLARNREESWREARHVLGLSEWLGFRLCGEIASDPSQAGETLLFDLALRDWAWDCLGEPELPPHLFPDLSTAGSRLGALTARAAEPLGLAPGTPVGLAGAGARCGLLALGALAAGEAAAITGSVASVQHVLDRPELDPNLGAGHHLVADRWVAESSAGPLGHVLDWLAAILEPEGGEPAARVLAEAARTPAGATGMLSTLGVAARDPREFLLPVGHLALPHLVGSDLPSNRGALLRAIVEGMAYALRSSLESVRSGALRSGELRLAGGLSRSAFWAQLLSDVIGEPLRVSRLAEASSLGAAICAGVAIGAYRDLAGGAAEFAGRFRIVEPDSERSQLYDERYADWLELRDAEAVRTEPRWETGRHQ